MTTMLGIHFEEWFHRHCC